MPVYYNEFDPFAAQWLRNLIMEGHLPRGDVDTRSITEVQPDDLRGYTQCHFFAGIGGWPLALRMAGWDDTRPIWTGSCPCQPFSTTGRRRGKADERHLLPVWFRLAQQCKPPVVFGEQVRAAIAFGWLDDVANDLEGEGYAFAAAVLPACAAGAPHKRDRIFLVADREREGLSSRVLKRPNTTTEQSSEKCRGRFRYQIGTAWNSEPQLAVLVHGLPSDVAASKAFGNAVVPQITSAFILVYIGCVP